MPPLHKARATAAASANFVTYENVIDDAAGGKGGGCEPPEQ